MAVAVTVLNGEEWEIASLVGQEAWLVLAELKWICSLPLGSLGKGSLVQKICEGQQVRIWETALAAWAWEGIPVVQHFPIVLLKPDLTMASQLHFKVPRTNTDPFWLSPLAFIEQYNQQYSHNTMDTERAEVPWAPHPTLTHCLVQIRCLNEFIFLSKVGWMCGQGNHGMLTYGIMTRNYNTY